MALKPKYITYSILGIHKNNTPIAVDCSNISTDDAYEIYADSHSLHGLGNVRVNYSGKIRKDIVIITPKEHYKYDWHKLSQKYYNKMFKPKN